MNGLGFLILIFTIFAPFVLIPRAIQHDAHLMHRPDVDCLECDEP
jgi:hypothetical protein